MIVSTGLIVEERERRGWSQAFLAEQSGVSRTEISAIETGRLTPSVGVALRLARALGRSVEELFSEPSKAIAEWAWQPRAGTETRYWEADVRGRLLRYPVEPTAAGVVAHDGVVGRSAATVERPAMRTLVLAGCDPLAGLLLQEAAAQQQLRIVPLLRSSTESLALLKAGLVHMAGVHFSNHTGSAGNEQAVRHSMGAGYSLLHQVCWDAGVVLAPARRERTARALLRANVRWVNREEGSAARMAFDRLLGTNKRPSGYDRVVRDHRAVATTVSSGWAEAGMCVAPAAAEAHLPFIPLQREAYEICLPTGALADAAVSALLATFQSTRYRRLLDDVPGCDARQTGDVRDVA